MAALAPFVLAACQARPRLVFGADGLVRPDLLNANVDDYCRLIALAAREHHARLIVFPQFGLTSHAMVDNDAWLAASLLFPGPELDRIGQAAKDAGAYVVVQAAERHAAFPGRYFLSAAIITPDGAIGLTYRKHYTLSFRTSPIDIHDAFVAAFGTEAFYPVLDTPIGRIGLVIGAEVHWPEATRSLALNGAEIVVNPVAAAPLLDCMNRAGAVAVRGVRAFENMSYLAMANIGGVAGAPASEIYDYAGAAIGTAAGDAFSLATIDIEALRAARAIPSANLLAQIQPAIHEASHRLPLWPENAFADRPPATFDDLTAIEAMVWARLQNAHR